MFKLVQQAHEKVTSKEAEFAGRIAAERKKFESDFEKRLSSKMGDLQSKLDSESAKRRQLFNQLQVSLNDRGGAAVELQHSMQTLQPC